MKTIGKSDEIAEKLERFWPDNETKGMFNNLSSFKNKGLFKGTKLIIRRGIVVEKPTVLTTFSGYCISHVCSNPVTRSRMCWETHIFLKICGLLCDYLLTTGPSDVTWEAEPM